MQNKKGFTLLELLVVVLIIGILAAIALPQYQMAVAKSKFATLKDNARVIQSAMNRYYLMRGSFTTKLSDLDIDFSGNLSGDKHQINFSDGSTCYIGGSSIFCSRKLFGVAMEYEVVYTNFKDLRRCISFSQNSNDKPNRLCQQETGKTTGNEVGTWTSYSY